MTRRLRRGRLPPVVRNGSTSGSGRTRWPSRERLLDKYAPHLHPGRDDRPITDGELRRTAVYRIDIDAWSGKEKVAPPDFPGAYALPPPPSIPLREADAPPD